ncbi:hypothetical protein BWI17_01105 [Betaproteobacteria bacterium GR16-43]|nr:hypothetical protein BWI17_01105 [Betaproteobacteria bacterium GR16-43]
MRFALVALLSAATLSAGCASAPATSDEPRDEVVYQTGSNLPKKYRDPAQTTVDKDRAMERSTYETNEQLRSSLKIPK